jgi:hypothetical protein
MKQLEIHILYRFELASIPLKLQKKVSESARLFTSIDPNPPGGWHGSRNLGRESHFRTESTAQ